MARKRRETHLRLATPHAAGVTSATLDFMARPAWPKALRSCSDQVGFWWDIRHPQLYRRAHLIPVGEWHRYLGPPRIQHCVL